MLKFEIMIIVTGGAGFIGSNLVRSLCERGEEVVVVDDLSDGRKFKNIAACAIHDYWDKNKLLEHIQGGNRLDPEPRAILHQGACSDTTEWNGSYMLEANYEYSKSLFGVLFGS